MVIFLVFSSVSRVSLLECSLSFSFCTFCALSSFFLRNAPNFVWPHCLSKNSVGGISLTSFPICLGSVCVFLSALELAGWKMIEHILFLAIQLLEWGRVGSVASGSFNLWALLLNFVVFYNQFHFPFPLGVPPFWWEIVLIWWKMMPCCLWDFCSVHLLGVFLRILRPLCSGGLLSALSTARSEGETQDCLAVQCLFSPSARRGRVSVGCYQLLQVEGYQEVFRNVGYLIPSNYTVWPAGELCIDPADL